MAAERKDAANTSPMYFYFVEEVTAGAAVGVGAAGITRILVASKLAALNMSLAAVTVTASPAFMSDNFISVSLNGKGGTIVEEAFPVFETGPPCVAF